MAGKKIFYAPLQFSVAAFSYVRQRWGYITRADLASNLTAQQNFYTAQFNETTKKQYGEFASLGKKVAQQGEAIKTAHEQAEKIKQNVHAFDKNAETQWKKMLAMIGSMRKEMQDHQRTFEFKTLDEINGFSAALELQSAELEKQCVEIASLLKEQNIFFQKELEDKSGEVMVKLSDFNKEMSSQLAACKSKVDQMKAKQEKMQIGLDNLLQQGQSSQQQIEELRKKLALEQEKVRNLEIKIGDLVKEDKKKTLAVQFLTKEVDTCNEMLNQLEKKFNDPQTPSFKEFAKLIKKVQHGAEKKPASQPLITSMENLRADLFNKPSISYGQNG
ncbi:MAG TPA: hypothetical protein VHO47_03730 [Candidatus Babeliales bacterium]|nr:hypothetical protein [Candidatus Babeliales bacterium]